MTEPAPRFADLGLAPALLRAVAALGYDAPTPIQAAAIPELLRGRDLVGQARTGTGKTAAFGLPLLQGLDPSRRALQALVMAPTRELALQVGEALQGFATGLDGLRLLTVYGGAPLLPQLRELDRGVHVVVGTPGRLLDCLDRGALSLADVRFAVLDEADEMLRMGFLEDVERLLAATPPGRQTALFSATMPPAIRRIAGAHLSDPVTVRAQGETRTVAAVAQRVLLTHADDKVEALARVLEVEASEATLVFARTKAGCRELAAALDARGFTTAALHGDLGQPEREEVVRRLRAGEVGLVVATDVAARGLDVEGLSHVVNFDAPSRPETYVHRIGRTGRAGREGVSILLLTPRERRLQGALERFTRQPMTPMTVPSNAELAASRGRRLAAAATAVLDGDDLAPYRALVEQMAADRDGDLAGVAAALAHLCSQGRPLALDAPAPAALTAEPPRRPEPAAPRRPARPAPAARPPAPGPGRRARLFVSLGARSGLRPGDLVGAIANEAGLAGADIGPIDIRETVSFVEVPADRADEVVARMAQATIRGRRARVAAADPPGGGPVTRRRARAGGR